MGKINSLEGREFDPNGSQRRKGAVLGKFLFTHAREILHRPLPVSYTHLDVYKRQEQARKPLYTTGGEERSGMGFTIMESFMDKLTVRSAEGKGTRVTMRRRILPRPASK